MTQKGQWVFVMGIVGALVGGLVVGMTLTPALQPIGVQSKAPAFEAVDVRTGETVTLEGLDGEVLLLNIWATWCGPCEAEMPSMQRLHDSMGDDGLRVIAVSVDNRPTDLEDILDWVEDRDLTFTVLHDATGSIERDYQTTGVPESFVIDRDGVIIKKVIGATEWDHPTQQHLIQRLLRGHDVTTDDRD
jgi:peroxiredoxin